MSELDSIIGGPCTRGCGDVAGHPGLCLVRTGSSRKLDCQQPTAEERAVEMGEEVSALKAHVKRLEHQFSDLGAFVQAAVKEMRQHAENRREESLLGLACLRCGASVVYDFYCESHLPPKIRVIWEEIKTREAKK
ncbi:hypothetical protein LCGC14_2502770 [marine sediment metagenome]|uniref:Uncharacterized protein n=1 Tax=marine sediment metagenome TaxID=412755 RepID=A0A0F9DV52_9ZZZZ